MNPPGDSRRDGAAQLLAEAPTGGSPADFAHRLASVAAALGHAPEALGAAWELHLERSSRRERKRNGSFYTPPDVVERLLDGALEPAIANALEATPDDPAGALLGLRVIDPACGTGHFLLAAGRRLARHLIRFGVDGEAAHRAVVARCLFGVDVDPVAAALCRAALGLLSPGAAAERNVLHADALVSPAEWSLRFPQVIDAGGFSVVLGNPPYVDSERMQRDSPGQREAIARRFETARGNWDLYVPFVELSLQLLAPGGRMGLVTPVRLLASNYGALVQRLLLGQSPELFLDLSGRRVFGEAEIDVLLSVVRRTPAASGHRVVFEGAAGRRAVAIEDLRALPPGYIGFPLSSARAGLLGWLRSHSRLREVAQVSDGATTAEAYLLQPLVRQAESPLPDDVRLVNTGTIDPFRLRWGESEIRYLGFVGTHPAIARTALERFPRRARQAAAEKVVVAGLCRRIEAAVAGADVLCGKSATVVVPEPGICPRALAVVLNSDAMGELYRGLFGLRGLGGKSLAVGPRQLEVLPVPPREWLRSDGPLSRLGRALEACGGTDQTLLAQAEAAVLQAFGGLTS